MQQVRLRDICTLQQWAPLPKRNFTPTGYPVYGANGIIGFSDKYNHQQPAIAITCRGDSCGNAVITQPFSYISANAICLENIADTVSQQYLYYCLKSADLSACISGAAQPQITQKNLGNIQVPIYPKERQQYIADTLHKIEQTMLLRQQQLEAVKQLQASFFHRVFPTLMAAEHCPKRPLHLVAEIHCGKRNAGDATPTGEYPFFSCAKTPRRISNYTYDCECVLLTGNIDFQIEYFHGKFDAYQRVYIIESRHKNTAVVPYLYAFLQHYAPTLKQQAVGGIIKYIRRDMLTNISIPLPDLKKQHRIGSFALHTLKLGNDILQSLQKEEELFKSALTRFFPPA